jgi:hypothetical protein
VLVGLEELAFVKSAAAGVAATFDAEAIVTSSRKAGFV